MSHKSTIEIDYEAGTVTVMPPEGDLCTPTVHTIELTKDELVSAMLAIRARQLMGMSKNELMARHLLMLEE